MKYHCPKCNVTVSIKTLVPYQKTVERGCCLKCSHKRVHTCPRCDNVATYCNEKVVKRISQRPYCCKCKHIPDASLEFFKQQGKFIRQCPRCNIKVEYKHKQQMKVASKCSNCRKCKNIPDESLEAFKQGRYVKHCPKCNREQEYVTKQGLRAAIRLNLICHSCHSKASAPLVKIKLKKWRDNLTPQERAKLSEKMSSIAKKSWRNLSEEEKKLKCEAIRLHSIRWQETASPAQIDAWKFNLKKSFEKYRGENHWSHRIDTMAKTHASYIKYLGKNHWRHRPGVNEKIMASIKHNKHIKETVGEI